MNSSYVDFVKEQLSGLGPIDGRGLFGGTGLYLNGVIFGFVDGDTIYFKVTDSNKQDYIDEGMEPFVYQGKNKPVSLSYYQIPERLLDEPDELLIWAEKAVNASLEKKK